MQGMWTSGALQGEDEEVGSWPYGLPKFIGFGWYRVYVGNIFLLIVYNRMVQFEAR